MLVQTDSVTNRWVNELAIVLYCLLVAGCSDHQLNTKIVFGNVSCGGEPVADGYVRFVPIEGTPGPASTGKIVDGKYRIDQRGGVPVGKHRVEIVARKKTGKKVYGTYNLEPAQIDETVLLGPSEHEGTTSPLVREITDDSDGQIDIEIPRNPGGPMRSAPSQRGV